MSFFPLPLQTHNINECSKTNTHLRSCIIPQNMCLSLVQWKSISFIFHGNDVYYEHFGLYFHFRHFAASHQQIEWKINRQKVIWKRANVVVIVVRHSWTSAFELLSKKKRASVDSVYFVSRVYYSNNPPKSRMWFVVLKVYRLQKAKMRLLYRAIRPEKQKKIK